MRVKNINNLSVVSILFLTIACTTVPARADVYITPYQVGEPCDGRVMIGFDATSETNLVRAFAFDIQLNNDANIIEVTGINPDYYIYPGTIQIDASGNVIDYGTALANYSDLPSGTLTGLDSNGITIEMASLYTPVGPGSPNAPAKSGDLVLFRVNDNTCINISPNVARAGNTGVIMENPDEIVVVNYPDSCVEIDFGFTCYECLKTSDPGYSTWEALGKCDCWCYRHQCQGDCDGLPTFGRYVSLSDLNCLKAEFGKTITELQNMGSCGCADFDHIPVFGRPVGLSDLDTLKYNFGVSGLPECPMTHINCWKD